jgi:hypothetical protein
MLYTLQGLFTHKMRLYIIMGVSIQPLEQHPAMLVYSFTGRWAWEDFYEARQQADAWMDQQASIVDLILDFRESADLPPGAFNHLRTIIAHKHPRQGIIVALGVTSSLKAVSDTLIKIYPRLNYLLPRTAKTLDEAMRFCQQAAYQRRFVGSSRGA